MSNSASFDVNEWNPLKEAYDNTDFNSYDCGPGKYLTVGERKSEPVDVYVKNLPQKFTDDGLRALFSKAGKVLKVKICRSPNSKLKPFGFVTFAFLSEAEVAISKFNHWKIAGSDPLFVKLSFKDENRITKCQQKLQESAYLKDSCSRVDSSNESDSEDDCSDSEIRPCIEKLDKYAQYPNSSSHGNQCSSHCYSKETRKMQSKNWEKNAKSQGNLEVSSDRWGYSDSHEESTNHRSLEKKTHTKSSVRSSNNSQDDSKMMQLQKQCVNCGSEATKRCSSCSTMYCCMHSDVESTNHRSLEKKTHTKSSVRSSNNSQDGSRMMHLQKQCVNCGSDVNERECDWCDLHLFMKATGPKHIPRYATKRCSRCKMPYCSVHCQEKDWMNGHQNECFSFSNMSLHELADRFDVDLDLDTSVNRSKYKGSQSSQESSHQKRCNYSSSNHKVCDSSPKSDAVIPKHDKSQRKSYSKRESDIENVYSDDFETTDKWPDSVLSRTKPAQSIIKQDKTVTAIRNDNFEESSLCHTLSNGDSKELETVKLPSRGTCQVLVTYVNKLNIYVQLSTEKNQNIQKEILCKLYKSSEQGNSLLRNRKSVKIGQLYACAFSEDGVWYRAMLVEVLESDRVKVKYIDFGNCEVTTIDKLRFLPSELKQVPQQAICCVLNLPSEATSAKHSTKLAALIEKHILQDTQYLLKVVNDSTPPAVFIYDDEGNKINKKIFSSLDLNNEAFTSDITKTSDVNTPQVMSSPPVMACDIALVPCNLKYGGSYKVKVLDVKSPESFLIQLADEPSRDFCQFTKKLTTYAESYSSTLERPLKGQLVLTKLETQEWARAEVVDVKNDSLLVSLIDFGMEEMVCLENYCPAMPFCLDYPCLCIPSKFESVNFLGRKDDSSKMCRRFTQILKFLTKSEDFSQECILGLYMGCENNKCQWNLYDSLGETSVMDMLASSLKVMASDLKGFQVSIGDVLDGLAVEILTDTFYIIVASEKQISFLEEFNTYLEKKDNGNGYTPCIDEMVAAKFSQDNQWYRGQIIGTTSDGKYKVFFVDYGNSEYVDKLQLQPFPVHFTLYPKQALHCYLPGVHGIKDNEKFSQLICSNVCKYKIEGCNKNVYEVIVYTSDGSCVNDCFEESLEKDVTNDYFPKSQSLNGTRFSNGTATSKSNSVKSASSISLSPLRSRSQSPQSSIEEQPVESLSPNRLSSVRDSPSSCHRYHRDSSDIFETQFSSEKELPDDRQTKESIRQSLSTKTSKQEAPYQEDMLTRSNRTRYFAKSMGILQLKVQKEYELLCKWIVDTDRFYCQLLDDIAMEALSDMTEQLNEMCETSHLNSTIQPDIGEVVCSKYSDGKWYRAKVMEVSKTKFAVFYVDFGCSGIVERDEIMPLTVELSEIPILAARCSLAGKSKEKWTKEKLLQLREQPIIVQVVGETHNSYSVVLKEDFQDKKETDGASSSSNENISSKEIIRKQIEQLKQQLELMD